MRCAIYCRVSSDRQREKHTIDSQLRILPEYAKAQGWEVIGEPYIDDGRSAETIEDRPAFSRLLDDATQRKFDLVLVIDDDRLSRSKSDLTTAMIYDTFRENGISLATPLAGLMDLSNEEQDLYTGMKRQFAKYEKRKFLSRTRRGRLEKWKKGVPGWGKQPYGYAYDKSTKAFTVHPEHSEIVRLIFSLCVNDGFGLDRIARELNARAIECPSVAANMRRKSVRWAKSTVTKILSYEGYCGTLSFNRLTVLRERGKDVRTTRPKSEWIGVQVPALISRELFEAAQRAKRQRRILSDRNKVREYLCGGLLHCAECGSKLCGEPSHGRAYYVCYGRKTKHLCQTPWLPASGVDGAVWSLLEGMLSNPAILEDAIAHAFKDRSSDKFASQDHLQKLLAEKEREEIRTIRLYGKASIGEARLDQALEDIRRERKILERNLELLQQQSDRRDQVRKAQISLKDLAKRIKQFTFKDKREVLKTFIDGTPGTGVFVAADRSLRVVGVIPVPQPALPGSDQFSSMIWTLPGNVPAATKAKAYVAAAR